MYGVDIACYDDEPEVSQIIIPLLKEVLGYNEQEIKGFKHWLFFPPLAMNLTKEEVRLIMQPFWDNDISVWAFEIDDETGEHIMFDEKTGYMTSKYFGVVAQPPQEHYYDKPVVTRDKLIDPWNPPTNNEMWIHPNLKSKIDIKPTNIPKCPTCGSTNIKHISTLNRAVSVGVFGLLSGKIGKNYECLNCKARW